MISLYPTLEVYYKDGMSLFYTGKDFNIKEFVNECQNLKLVHVKNCLEENNFNAICFMLQLSRIPYTFKNKNDEYTVVDWGINGVFYRSARRHEDIIREYSNGY